MEWEFEVFTVEGHAHVLLAIPGGRKHEGLGVLGEQQVSKVLSTRLWRREPLMRPRGRHNSSCLTGEEPGCAQGHTANQ